jgi:hypothetical protein
MFSFCYQSQVLSEEKRPIKITNSSIYGIIVEINTTKKEDAQVRVFGNNDESFECERDSIERFGVEFNPIVSVFITSAARLVLAITEALPARRGSLYAFCDTDSMTVPPECMGEIQEYFQKLFTIFIRCRPFQNGKGELQGRDKGTRTSLVLWYLSEKICSL